MIGARIEFRIERDDAAIGVFELARETRQFFLTLAQIGQRGDQLAILALQFRRRVLARLTRKRVADRLQVARHAIGQRLRERDRRDAVRYIGDRSLIHQTLSR